MIHTDVVISGGGIGGAVLAALLVQGGKRVTIVEKATGPPPFLRPELLWPPALRVLERIRPLEAQEAGLAADFAALVAENPDIPPALAACGFPNGYKRIGREWGLAASYGVPGCVLIGDAIHPVSPAGGQGANMAIGDAAALAGFILENNPDPAGALWEERRAAHERGVRPSSIAAAAFKAARIPGARLLLGGIISLALGSEGLRVRALRALGS